MSQLGWMVLDREESFCVVCGHAYLLSRKRGNQIGINL